MAVEQLELPSCAYALNGKKVKQPRCAFHPQGLGKRCNNEAALAVIAPTSNGTFWYFPCCESCKEEAGELRDETYFVATLLTEARARQCDNDAVFAVIAPSGSNDFDYFPVCADCTDQADNEFEGTFFLAHMYGHGDDDDS